MFKLALVAKKNIDIDNLINPSDQKLATPAIFEEARESENAQDKAAKLTRSLEEQRRHGFEENALIKAAIKCLAV